MLLKIYKKLYFVIYLIYLKYVCVSRSASEKKSILIIKTDAIGDYILFRNFLQEIKQSERFKDFYITVIGNELWQDFALTLDRNLIDHYIGVNPNIQKDHRSWQFFLKKVAIMPRQHTLITFHYSRTWFNDLIAYVVKAGEKITMNGDDSTITKRKKKLGDNFYDRFINIPEIYKHEFDFNKEFTSLLLDTPINFELPYINNSLASYQTVFSAEKNYIVIGPSAGRGYRQLDLEQLLYALNLVCTTEHTLCFVGTAKDNELVQQIIEGLPEHYPVLNAIGKTSLPELLTIVKNSKAVVCYDSSIYHMAIACKKPVLCFAGGGHFDRFVTYSHPYESVIIINQPMPCYNCNWKCIFYSGAANEPFPCLKSISQESLKHGVDNLITELQLIDS